MRFKGRRSEQPRGDDAPGPFTLMKLKFIKHAPR